MFTPEIRQQCYFFTKKKSRPWSMENKYTNKNMKFAYIHLKTKHSAKMSISKTSNFI